MIQRKIANKHQFTISVYFSKIFSEFDLDISHKRILLDEWEDKLKKADK